MGPDKVEKLLQRAQQAIAERDWEKAKQVYLLALGLRSDLVDVHYGLATVYFQLRELTSAAHHFREVTRLDPHRSGAFINLGAVLNVLEQFDEAVTALRRGIQLDGKRVEGFYNLGLVYKRKGQNDLAVSAYKEALRLNPRMADAHLNLANIYLEREQPRMALQHYEQAAQLRPGWEKAAEGVLQAKAALEAPPVAAGATAASPGSSATHRTMAAPDLDRLVDPVAHATFLTNLHQATVAYEETGRLLQKIVGEEIESVIKELSSALLHKDGSRGELEACITKFEGALGRMKTAHQALRAHAGRIDEIGERFPTH
jgi:tetratricopeptide (TPR) repeat protein